MKIKKDLLNRGKYNDFLVNLVDLLSKDGESHAFAIDGKWGSGKSWILDKFERQLQGISEDDDLETAKGNYFVFHYNAWENDFYDEPLVAILSVIINKLNALNKLENFIKGLKKEAVDICKSTLSKLTEILTGMNIFNITKDIKKKGDGNTDFDKMVDIKSAITYLRNSLETLINNQVTIDENGNVFPIIFVVDELDRCLPEYAIKVLERLHHVFNELPHCILILSIDKNQLGNTIKNIFGESINLPSYLNKFIDFSVQLNEGNINTKVFLDEFEKYKSAFEKDETFSSESAEILLKVIFNGLSMRERIEIVRKAYLAHNMCVAGLSTNEKNIYFELFITVLQYLSTHSNEEYLNYFYAVENIYKSKLGAQTSIASKDPLKSLYDYFYKRSARLINVYHNIPQYIGDDDFFSDLFDIQYYLFVYKDGITRIRGSLVTNLAKFYNVVNLLN